MRSARKPSDQAGAPVSKAPDADDRVRLRPAPGPVSLRQEIADGVSLRTVGLLVGVLLLQLGFIFSYVAAFHDPTPHDIPVAVAVAGQTAAAAKAQDPSATGPRGTDKTVGQLNALDGSPLVATSRFEDEARADLSKGRTSAVLVLDPQGTRDTLLVATGGGTSVATAAETVLTKVEDAQGRSLNVVDEIPLQSGDARGLTGFYAVIGWIVGGYLMAALLGVAKGAKPANTRRAIVRLLAVLPYAVISGLGGALIVDPLLGALTGHFFALWGIGALLVVAAAVVTLAFQILLGVIGIGVTVLLFVVLGNPSAGGAYQANLLPAFWRGLGGWLPNGAGTEAVRGIVYFDGADVLGPALVIVAYVIGGAVVALLASRRHVRRTLARVRA